MPLEDVEETLIFRDVSGKTIRVYGRRRVEVYLDGCVPVVIPFIVADVHRQVISLGKLAARDFDIYLGNTSSYIERNYTTAGLVRRNHTFYFDLKVKASRELTAAPAVEELRPATAAADAGRSTA